MEHYIQNIAMEFSFLPHNAPVNLVPEALPSFSSHSGRDLRVVIADLRLAIAVLFTFQRRPIKDEGFISDTRNWLTRLVAILLRVATWRDHMFILNHVLRYVFKIMGDWNLCSTIHILVLYIYDSYKASIIINILLMLDCN